MTTKTIITTNLIPNATWTALFGSMKDGRSEMRYRYTLPERVADEYVKSGLYGAVYA